MKDDDVEFRGVKADEGDVGREGDRHTERCDLDLKFSKCQNRGIRLIVILRDMTTKKKFPIRVVSARIVDLLKIK